MKKLFLVDGMAVAYKAYYAFINRPLRNSRKQNISAVYGFLNILLSLIEKDRPDYLAVAFDSKEKTFRHDKYELYKANRMEMPEEMIMQIQWIIEILESLDIKIYRIPGFEADDLIGTVANKVASDNLKVYLITPDKDYLQLLDENTFIYRPGKKQMTDLEIIKKSQVKEILGIENDRILDYFALTGDASDNVPGVKGIGEKTAIELLSEYKDIDDIYRNIEKISKKAVKEKLINSKDQAYLSKELVTINRNVPLEINIENLKYNNPKLNRTFEILRDIEIKAFNTKISELFSDISIFNFGSDENATENLPKQFNQNQVNYKIITDIKPLAKLKDDICKYGKFVLDTETDNLNVIDAKLIGISISFKAWEAYFIPFINSDEKFKNEIISFLKQIMSDKKILLIGQNLKYDLNIIKNLGVNPVQDLFDTMIASYIINPNNSHNLDDLALRYLNYKTIKISELIGKNNDASLMLSVPVDKLAEYSAEDADITFRLYEILQKEISSVEAEELCEKIEFPLVKVLADMERTGVFVDTDELNRQSEELSKKLYNYENLIYEQAGEIFNLNSPKQLQKILFDKLNLSPVKKTTTGFSTDNQTLEQLRFEHPIISNLIDYRELFKLKSTYIDALPKLINPKTKRIHTSYNQTVASTGRLSSSNPNLQNIPIRTEVGKDIRKAFIPQEKDYQILSADYSQIELRIMAHLCEDENMLKTFRDNVDVHTQTASLVYNCPKEEVTSEMRRKAKEVNFGIIYGIGPHGLKTRLGITQAQAKEIIDNYFRSFPGIKNYLDTTIKFAREKGYVETLLKRRRYLPNINSKNFTVRSFEERAAINMPIQGTASDLIKIAMIKIFEKFNELNLKSKMIMQVHDELVFEVKSDELSKVKAIIQNEMENALTLKVPIKVDIGIGENWLDAH